MLAITNGLLTVALKLKEVALNFWHSLEGIFHEMAIWVQRRKEASTTMASDFAHMSYRELVVIPSGVVKL